jgi:hypothetical protein
VDDFADTGVIAKEASKTKAALLVALHPQVESFDSPHRHVRVKRRRNGSANCEII